jgi:hypothetical protein
MDTKTDNTSKQEESADAVDASIPAEYLEKVNSAVAAMQRSYIARCKCAANRKKNLAEKRRAAAKNAKKMRKMQRRHKK